MEGKGSIAYYVWRCLSARPRMLNEDTMNGNLKIIQGFPQFLNAV